LLPKRLGARGGNGQVQGFVECQVFQLIQDPVSSSGRLLRLLITVCTDLELQGVDSFGVQVIHPKVPIQNHQIFTQSEVRQSSMLVVARLRL